MKTWSQTDPVNWLSTADTWEEADLAAEVDCRQSRKGLK